MLGLSENEMMHKEPKSQIILSSSGDSTMPEGESVNEWKRAVHGANKEHNWRHVIYTICWASAKVNYRIEQKEEGKDGCTSIVKISRLVNG